eukprot:365535-Chlamydomonas_euryale.AAC.1
MRCLRRCAAPCVARSQLFAVVAEHTAMSETGSDSMAVMPEVDMLLIHTLYDAAPYPGTLGSA